ncbi:MAG: hypothetical protein ACSLFN_09300 [Candidatus Limnocylindrales bacterium]
MAVASPVASALVSRSPVSTSVVPSMDPDAASTAVALLAALQPRDAWGVRIVVPESAALGRGAPLTERWRERSSGETDRSIRFWARSRPFWRSG